MRNYVNKVSVSALAIAAGMTMAGGASAGVIDFVGSDASSANGSGFVQVFSDDNALEREFNFVGPKTAGGSAGTPFFAYLDMNVSREFSLVLEDYQPTNTGSAQSFFSILNLGTNSFVTTASTCSSTLAAINGYNCNPVNGTNGSAGNPPPIAFSGLEAGNYRISFYESGDPDSVQADFRVSAVPLPAAGFLLFGALGGLAAMRRRKKASAA